jgi:hypothetical protein
LTTLTSTTPKSNINPTVKAKKIIFVPNGCFGRAAEVMVMLEMEGGEGW